VLAERTAAFRERDHALAMRSSDRSGGVDGTAPDVVLVRHGATEWSASGRHTGTTDIPLLPEGEHDAEALRPRLAPYRFALVLTSPRRRARETCRLAGFDAGAQVDDDLVEWDYGDYEGRTTADIREERGDPHWTVWIGPIPGGETVDQVGARVDRVIARAVAAGGPVALFGHAHCLRILTARWLGLQPRDGRLFVLGTGTLSGLGHERDTRALMWWNT
jgi:probable phosphoglycerate mutase